MQKEEIKSGFLQVPPSWLQHLLNKPWVKKQCVLYPASRQGVRRLEVFDLAPSLRRKEPATLIIPLTDCVKIAEEHHKGKDFVFSVVTREESHMFAAVSIQELRGWVDALQRIAFSEAEGMDCPKMLALLAPSKSLPQDCDDNVLYGSTTQNRTVFPVTVDENETALRLQMTGPHVVQILAASIQLRTIPDRRLRASWLFSHIRRYGQTRGSFAMEVGRSSETGPGSFVFRTREAGELQSELQRVMTEYELNRHSAAPDLPTSLPPTGPPQPPPPPPLETQTLGRLGYSRKVKKTTIAKPPRRTKAAATAAATAEDLPNVVPLAEKQWLLTQSMKIPSPDDTSVYSSDVMSGAASAPYIAEPDELMYAEPQERQSAWRELGRSVEHVEHEVVSRRSSAILDTWDAAAAEGMEPLLPSPNGTGGRPGVQLDLDRALDRASTSYARLQHMPRTTEPSGGQYARLGVGMATARSVDRIAAWAADQSQRQEAEGEGEAAAEESQPLYENLSDASAGLLGSAATKSTPVSEAGHGSEQGAATHMMVNEDIYTLLDKPLQKGSS